MRENNNRVIGEHEPMDSKILFQITNWLPYIPQTYLFTTGNPTAESNQYSAPAVVSISTTYYDSTPQGGS